MPSKKVSSGGVVQPFRQSGLAILYQSACYLSIQRLSSGTTQFPLFKCDRGKCCGAPKQPRWILKVNERISSRSKSPGSNSKNFRIQRDLDNLMNFFLFAKLHCQCAVTERLLRAESWRLKPSESLRANAGNHHIAFEILLTIYEYPLLYVNLYLNYLLNYNVSTSDIF